MFEEIREQITKIQELTLERARLLQEDMQANSKEREKLFNRCPKCTGESDEIEYIT